MALTKVTGDFIKAGSITQGHLHSSHGITTSHIAEGDKLFFTNARVASYLSSNNYVSGTGTNNRLAIWNGTGVIDSDSDFYVDGDTIFTTNFQASGNISITGTSFLDGDVTIGDTNSAFIGMARAGANYLAATNASGYLVFRTAGSNERMRVGNSGNVGIGTTMDINKLDVAGNINVQGGDGSYLTFNNGDANIVINNNGSGRDLSFKTYDGSSNSERMRIDKDGNIGIGTTSPLQKVHLLNGGFAYMRFTSQSYGATGFDIGQHTNGNIYLNNRDNTSMVFMTNNATALTINNSQNATFAADITVSGGDITLGGTGRIQGIDTVSANTDAANKLYVDNQVAGIVDSAPGTLNTLNELAAALGDDANFSATVTNSIGLKAPLASPSFTGNATFAGGISVSSPGSSFYTTFKSANDYVIGLKDSANTTQWWLKAFTNGSFALHEDSVGDKFTIAAGGNATFAGDVQIDTSLSIGKAGGASGIGNLTLFSRYSVAAPYISFKTDHPSQSTVWETGRIDSTDSGNFNGKMLFKVATGSGSAAGGASMGTVLTLDDDSSATFTGSIVAGTNPDTTPGGTAFSHTFTSVGGNNRVVNFEGASSSISTWYSVGNVPYSAIDNSLTTQSFWRNAGSGWQKQMDIYRGYVESIYSFRAPIFYDSDNTSYYLDPNATSILNRIEIDDDLDVRAQVGTWITSNIMGDAIGWNTSYGVYIGSNVGGTHYLRGNGTFTTGGNTYNLWHQGNDGSGSGLDADLLDGSHASSFWTKSGTWYGDLGSHSYTREIGLAMTGGSEFVILSKSGQGSVLVDGHYMAYESANGFFGSYNSAYGNLTGIRATAANTLKVMQLDGGNAILEVTQDARAPIFYDSNDTAYYVNPATFSVLKAVQINTTSNTTGSALKIYTTTNHQYPQIHSDGSLEAMWNYRNSNAQWYVGIRTSSQLVGTSGFHFYNTTSSQTVGGWDINGHSYSIASSRAPIFYDSNDTSYYVNPNSDSVMNQIHINDYIRHNGDLDTYMGFNGANSWKLHVGGGDRLIATTSQFTSNLNVAAPLYYDKDSTAHYVHPGNLSNLSGLNVQYGNMDLRYSNTVDMTGSSYNQSTYYPVRIYVSDITRIRIENRLNAGGTHPSWATHGSGFSLVMDWYTNGSGWGTVGVARTLRQWNEAWANVTICGGITQMTNSSAEVVWLRGGGKYLIKTSFNNTVQVSSSSHTGNSQTVTPTTSIVNNVYSSVSGSIGAGNIYGHKFWDAGDANYFLNPADTSISLKVKGTAEFVTAAGNLRGYIRATDTNDSHFIIATSGGEDIAFKDGGTSGTTNMIVRGDGDVIVTRNLYATGYYDQDNTGYYLNPASTSNLNAATFAGNVIGQNAYFNQDVGIGFTSGNIGGNLNIRNSAAGQTAAKIELGSSSNGSTIGAFIHTGASYASSGMFLNFQSNHISGDDNVLICYLDGDLVNKNNSYTQYSDERLKENIVDATPKLNEIKQIKVRNFNFKGEDLKQIGVVAQEFESIFPALVKEREVPGHEEPIKTVKYSVLVPILIKAMQEQQTIIDDLKSRLETLENQ